MCVARNRSQTLGARQVGKVHFQPLKWEMESAGREEREAVPAVSAALIPCGNTQKKIW